MHKLSAGGINVIKRLKPYILWIALTEAVGALSALLTREGTEYFTEFAAMPPLSPPEWVFPVVWTALYALMGISAARIWSSGDSQERSWGLNLYIIQLVLNFFWTLIFFNAMAYGVASVWIVALWAAVLAMVLAFYKVDHTAALLQLPYLAWLTFATYLTFGVSLLNG